MSFRETYQAEVIEQRRIRSRRAGFWAKLVGFMLVIVVGATLRSEPELRTAILTAGMDQVRDVTRNGPATTPTGSMPPGKNDAPSMTQMLMRLQGEMANTTTPGPIETDQEIPPRNGIRINRPGATPGTGPRFRSVIPAESAQPTGPIPTATSPNPMDPHQGQMRKMTEGINKMMQAIQNSGF